MAKLLKIFYLRKQIGIFVAFRSVFLWHFGRCFCGVLAGVFAVGGGAGGKRICDFRALEFFLFELFRIFAA